jgi:alginate O-acetyltransferase complex protein AlgI
VIFDTWTFAVFASTALAIYWLAIPKCYKPAYLAFAGCVFYAWALPLYLGLVAVLSTLTFGAAHVLGMRGIAPALRRATAVAAIVALGLTLALFKYASFLDRTVSAVAHAHLVPLPQLVVPLGISFFTFEFVHVVADAYAGSILAIDSVDFAVFALFFPTLVAGPIKRYQAFAPQVRAVTPLEPPAAARFAFRIALGLVKKFAVADFARVLAAPLAAPSATYGRIDYWVAALAYAIEIYADFSAYSDVAIGTAGLLGFTIPENFAHPYGAANVSAFWRRWHISLSNWVRDYIFVPLGGSRRAPPLVALNLLLAMAIVGLWHGPAWTFVAWGLWHGAGLAAHRTWRAAIVTRSPMLRRGGRTIAMLSVATTFSFVTLGWIVFASPSIPDAVRVFVGMFG